MFVMKNVDQLHRVNHVDVLVQVDQQTLKSLLIPHVSKPAVLQVGHLPSIVFFLSAHFQILQMFSWRKRVKFTTTNFDLVIRFNSIILSSRIFHMDFLLGVYDHHGLAHPYSSSNVQTNNSGPQHRTHEGYLRKRGHLLKQWKERWFVLDSVRHEVIPFGFDLSFITRVLIASILR